MRITEHKTDRMKFKLVEYTGIADFSAQHLNRSYGNRTPDVGWAHGSKEDMYRGCDVGDLELSKKADKYVDQFSNSAIQDHELTMEWNDQHGELDYDAAMAGEEMYMYGQTITETDRAPVNLYLDQWASCTLSPTDMLRRGIAILALVQALSIFRPVNAYIATGTKHAPTKTDVIQIIPVPTNPMDLSRASWMLASPCLFRQGLITMTFQHARSNSGCGIPSLTDTDWQRDEMGRWLANRDGAGDVIHLPLMMQVDHTWSSDKATYKWVKDNVDRFAS